MNAEYLVKTNQKGFSLFLALLIIAVAVCVAVLGWKISSTDDKLPTHSLTEADNVVSDTKYFKTREECESKTKKTCIGPQFCDYKCDKDFLKGAWIAEER